MVLRMSWTIDFASWANIPLAIDTDMAQMVALEARLRISWVVLMKRTVYWYSMYGSGG